MSNVVTKLDANLAIRSAFDDATQSLRTLSTPDPNAATSDLQQDQLTELQNINQSVQAVEAIVEDISTNTGVTNVALSSIQNKIGSTLVTEPYDNIELAYVGITTKIDTVTYKLGITTVATLTMVYDGSDRLTSVTRS